MSFKLDSFLRELLLFTALLASARNATAQIFELNLQNFDQFTKDKDVMLVEFYAPWCHHCQAFAPEWEKAATALAVNREFILGKADCVGSGKELCDRFHVQMYPMVKLFRHGVFQEDFEGDRTADAVVRYLQQAQSQPAQPQPAQPQPEAPKAPEALPPSNDPWQTGASFQYAYPMTTPPASQVPFAPVQNYVPTPQIQQIFPSVARAETKPPAGPPAPNGNFWFNTDLWNRNKPPAPSIALPQITHIAAPPQYVPYAPPRPAPQNVQNSEAASLFEYNSRDNTPFQAQTSTSQIGFKPPTAALALPADPLVGSYQGQLNAQNNQLGTSVVFIDGRPYAIRRIVNRYSNQHYPININSFQPFQRMGPGFLRGDKIPHIERPQIKNQINPIRVTPQRQIIPLRIPSSRNVQAAPQQIASRQQVPVMQRAPMKLEMLRNYAPKPAPAYNKLKPNYYQILSNFLQPKKQQVFESAQRRMPVNHIPNLSRPAENHIPYHQPTQAEMNKIFENYKRRLTNELRNQQLANRNTQQRPPFSAQGNGQPSGRFVVSIRGQGSKTVAAIKEKALHVPGFLNSLLNGRPGFNKVQQQQRQIQQRQQIQRHKQQQQQAQRRQFLMRQNQVKRLRIQSPAYVNVPQTDRALIRAKVLRPDLMAKARWAAKGVKTGTARGNIVYVPRSAFSRLPSWYRPKLGPALVKYVVKTKNTGNPLPMLAQGNKKQSLLRPPTGDLWHQIYRFYNKKNELQMRDAPYQPRPKPHPPLIRKFSPKFNMPNQPQHKPASPPLRPNKYYVNQPLYRVSNNANALYNSKKLLQQRSRNNINNYLNVKSGPKYIAADAYNAMKSKFNRFNAMPNSKQPLSPEIWDRRSVIRPGVIRKKSTIPQRPTRGGNWGTLKKKRSTNHNKRLRRKRRNSLRKVNANRQSTRQRR